MEPVLYPLKSALRGALILGLSLSVFAQIPAAPDASGFPSNRRALDFPLMALPPAIIMRPVFEFRGIRIGDGMNGAKRTFLALKVLSLSSDDVGSQSGPDLRIHGPSHTGKHLRRLRACVDHEVR